MSDSSEVPLRNRIKQAVARRERQAGLLSTLASAAAAEVPGGGDFGRRARCVQIWKVLAFSLWVMLAISAASGVRSNAQQLAAEPDTVGNPMAGNTAAIQSGKVLYGQTCEGCHGEEARGGRGPALAVPQGDGSAEAAMFGTVRSGIPGTQMPAFSALPADSIWRILAYVRSLSANDDSSREVVAGDPAAGGQVFWRKGGCGACHEVNGRGGTVGPDLSAVGMLPASYLRNKIIDPNSPPPHTPRFRPPLTVRVVTSNGQEIRGIARAEDNYTLLLTDSAGILHRIKKSELRDEETLRQSLMPSGYGNSLSKGEIQNLIAYLKTLKAPDLSQTAQTVLSGGLTYARLVHADREPGNWLTYWGSYNGRHFSALRQITRANVKLLQAKWTLQMPGPSTLESTPLVVDGTIYTSGQPGQVFAIDAESGLVIWKYQRQQKVVNPYQSNPFNRGLAILGERLFFGTLDAELVALDARTGTLLWETQVADPLQGYTITEAPLALQGKVVVGVAGGEFGIRGFIDAYDAQTGKRLWRFNTIPGPGEFGNDTWPGDSWRHGGGPAWLTGSYDPQLNLLYWTVGNPGPDLDGAVRPGDNLFTCSVLALDPATGERKWHYQFTPGDTHDWDANEDLILADQLRNGKLRKLLIQANRNGMIYELDRTNGRVLLAKPFVRETWNRGIGTDGRPITLPGWGSSPQGSIVYPSLVGGTNWQSPSFDASHATLYIVAHDGATGYRSAPAEYVAGRQYEGGSGYRAQQSREVDSVLAIDTDTGQIKWKFPLARYNTSAGVLATAGGIVFVCTQSGDLIALDAHNGRSLWHFQIGGAISSSPISYSVDGEQFIAVSAGGVLYSFALPE